MCDIILYSRHHGMPKRRPSATSTQYCGGLFSLEFSRPSSSSRDRRNLQPHFGCLLSSSMSHPSNCRCSTCHLSAKLFPRTPSDRIILPAPGLGGRDTDRDRARVAPPRPKSTAPDQYRPYQAQPPPPMPAPYRPSSSHQAPPPMPMTAPRPKHPRTPSQPVDALPAPQTGPSPYTFAPPERPASAMATSSPRASAGAPTQLKWVQKKKERVSHFAPASQHQGTSFRQYVPEGGYKAESRPKTPGPS
ncbi:hypothetical protein C8F01DRAFT_697735 [Mycena amicta]|nr:hypothetical protein C8F01DRAFT_697735 [Mycena amicta]